MSATRRCRARGGPAEIGRLISRVMAQRMDRSRPLWECWFCEGLPEGRWALLAKVHHSMVDGVSATDLYRLILDVAPEPKPPVGDDWRPAHPQSALSFTGRAVWGLAWSPVAGARAVGAALRSPRQLAGRAGQTAKGMLALTSALRPVQDSSLTGPLGTSRRYAWTTVSLHDVQTVRHQLGGTVNDVALAAVTGGFRALLLFRGEVPSAHTLRSLVPVSTRAPGAESVLDDRVSLLLPYLPVDLNDPRERLAAVQERVHALRSVGEAEAGDSITTLAGYGPYPPVSWGIRLGMHLPQHQITTVTTNVPGPRQTLYGLGREVQEILPYVPIADRLRIGVAMFSYRDALTFGITGDYQTVPDIEVLATGIARSMTELLDVTAQTH